MLTKLRQKTGLLCEGCLVGLRLDMDLMNLEVHGLDDTGASACQCSLPLPVKNDLQLCDRCRNANQATSAPSSSPPDGCFL